MAFQAIAPVSFNISMFQAQGQAFQSPAVNNLSSGSPQDLSAWVSLSCQALPASPGVVQAPVSFGTVTANSSGIITLQVGASDLAGSAPGTGRFVITGKPTSGDAAQILASGVLTLSQG